MSAQPVANLSAFKNFFHALLQLRRERKKAEILARVSHPAVALKTKSTDVLLDELCISLF